MRLEVMLKSRVLFMLAIFGMTARADVEFVDGISWEYTINNNEATIGYAPGYWGCAIPSSTSGEVKVPEILGGCPVVGIGNGALSSCRNISSVVLPRTLRNIGESAFAGNVGILAIEIPQSVTNVGYGAFSSCSKMTSCEFNEGLVSIGGYAFQNCTSLKRIDLPSTVRFVGNYAFSWCEMLTSVELANGIPEIYGAMFVGCEELEAITIPSTVTNIGEMAFAFCASLTSLEIPSSVISISDYAFAENLNLGTLVLNTGLRSIGESAFMRCTNLKEVEFPSSVDAIGDFAFFGCKNLELMVEQGSKSFEIIDGVLYDKAVETVVWCSSARKSVSLPASVHSVQKGAFAGCNQLTAIDVAESNISLCSVNGVVYDKDRTTLMACPGGLSLLKVHEGVMRIDDCACCDSGNLKTVELPESLREIGDTAFSGCTNLVSLSLPSNVARIGDWAFQSCSELKSVDMPLKLGHLGLGAFSYCSSLETIQIPTGITCIAGQTFEGCENLHSITIPENVTKIDLWAFANCTGLNSIRVLSGFAEIDPNAFNGCWDIKEMTIPSPEHRLAWVNPSYASITNLVISDGSTNIISSAFQDCRELVSVTIPASVTEIGQDAFKGCCKIVDVTMPAGFKLSEIFPDSYRNVRTLRLLDGNALIDSEAFLGFSSLVSVSIPPCVTRIGDRAFYDCCNLMSVAFAGDAPDVGVDVFKGTPKRMVVSVSEGSIGWNGGVSDGLPESWCGRVVVSSGTNPIWGEGSGKDQSVAVHMTVTNVVVHYVFNSIQPEIVVPVGNETDFVTVITEVKGGAVAIPESWAANYPTFSAKFGDDFAKAITKQSGKVGMDCVPMLVWQDYVAGTDPTDETDVFRASITMVEGKPVLSWTPELKPEQAALRKYTIYGKVKLQDVSWQVVDGDAEKYNFFRVAVEMK